MAANNWKYGLTLENIKAVMDSYKDEGNPPFRIRYKLYQNDIQSLRTGCKKYVENTKLREKCPVISKKADEKHTAEEVDPCEECPVVKSEFFETKLKECFSLELPESKCKSFTQRNILFFLLGGYLRFIDLIPGTLSYLFSGERVTGCAEKLCEDLIEWKAIPEDNGRWVFMNIQEDFLVPPNAISMLEFIIQTNEGTIINYCNSKSQESLLELLKAFAFDLGDIEKIAPKSISQMDHNNVERLKRLLDTLIDLADASKIHAQHPRYLAEGLTWLLIASLMRESFPHDQEEFLNAIKRAEVAAKEMGIDTKRGTGKTGNKAHILTIIPPTNRKVGLIGREEIVKRIGTLLEEEGSRILLYGVGGIGKTAVMQWICDGITGKSKYTAWINCKNSFKKDLLTFRSVLDIPNSFDDEEACNQIIKELETRFGNGLYLFVDGFPANPGMEDINLINSLKTAHIMVTSRAKNDYFDCVELERLKPEFAVQLFCKYYDRECENKKTVSKIIHSVNGHTLLIELLAKAAMKEGGSLDDFYQSMEEKGVFDFFGRKIQTAQGNDTIEKSIMKLYPLSNLSPEQQRIMKLFTIFTPERVIFYKVANWADLDMDALDELVDRALLSRVGSEGNYSIHQIIRDSIVRQMKNNNENLMIENYGNLLEFAISTDRYMHRNLVYKKVRERITLAEDIKEYLEERIQKDLDLEEYSKNDETYWLKNMATLYNNLSGIYSLQGDYLLALSCITKSLEIRKSIYHDDHELIATTYNNMSAVYRELGKYDQAMEYSLKALNIALEVLDHKNPTTASIYNNLGGICHALDKNEDALCYYKKALEIRQTLKGNKVSDTFSLISNIAIVYLDQGEFKSALEKLLDLEKSFQKEDLTKATIYACIASAYLGLNNYEKAIGYNKKALKIRKEILSDENPETAKSYNSLADVYKSNGEDGKALKYYKKALKIRKEKLGNDHPDTISTENCINEVTQKRRN